MITPQVSSCFGVTQHDSLPKDQPEAWHHFWQWFLTTPYAIFVPGDKTTEHTERLGCLFTEVPQRVLGVCGCARCVARKTPPCTCCFAQAMIKSDVFARARKMQGVSRNKKRLAAARLVAKKKKAKIASGKKAFVAKFKAPTLMNAVLSSFLSFPLLLSSFLFVPCICFSFLIRCFRFFSFLFFSFLLFYFF